MFDSAKAKLKENAKETLNELSNALASVNRDFLVAGHTDSNPIKTKKFPSNWELSTQRAIAVVNHMVKQGYPRDKIGAAGYADVDPVAEQQDAGGAGREPAHRDHPDAEPGRAQRHQEALEGLRSS